MVRSGITALLLAAAVAVPAAAPAQSGEPPAEKSDPQEMAREGLEMLLRALENLVGAIPQYEMPEVNERGDIIIRRKNPPAERKPEAGEPEVERI